MIDAGLQAKLETMKEILRDLKRVAVGFSAGVDSTFLLKVAVDTLGPANVVAVTADSESLTRRELDDARKLAAQMGVEHVVVRTDEMDDPNYRANPANRCYYCKQALFRKLDEFCDQRGAMVMVIGVNTDDFSDFRPGLQASKEKGVRMPAAEAGHEQGRRPGTQPRDGPADPRQAVEPVPGLAAAVWRGDHRPRNSARSSGPRRFCTRSASPSAASAITARWPGSRCPADQIERLCEPATRARIDAALREFGYQYVAVDIRGFRSGSLNEMLVPSQRAIPSEPRAPRAERRASVDGVGQFTASALNHHRQSPRWQVASNEACRIDTNLSLKRLVTGMKMRRSMVPVIHGNDDPVEPTDLGHTVPFASPIILRYLAIAKSK